MLCSLRRGEEGERLGRTGVGGTGKSRGSNRGLRGRCKQCLMGLMVWYWVGPGNSNALEHCSLSQDYHCFYIELSSSA